MILRLFSPHGHGQCKAMRYISKHEADVYLDKEEKTHSRLRPRLRCFLQMSSLDSTTMELVPILAQCCGMALCIYMCVCVCVFLFFLAFPLFLSKNPDAVSLFPQADKNKEIDNNLKQSAFLETNSRKIYFSL